MVITKAMITTQKGKTVFNMQLLENTDDSKPMTHRDLADLFVRVAELEEELRTRLAKNELGVQEFRVAIPGPDQNVHQHPLDVVKAFQDQVGNFNADIKQISETIQNLKNEMNG